MKRTVQIAFQLLGVAFLMLLAAECFAVPLKTEAAGKPAQPITWIDEVNILDLKPTQIYFGEIAAEIKRRKLKDLKKHDKEAYEKYLEENPIIGVLGPDNQVYIVDHHHLAIALYRLGEEKVQVKIIADLRRRSPESFWKTMKDNHWVFPLSQNGRIISNPDTFKIVLPSDILHMKDDVYRSLAGAVRDMGGFNKDEDDYYIEFIWANYFRDRIDIGESKEDFIKALRKALEEIDANRGLAAYLKTNCQALMSKRHITYP